jgi:hypothetical protein
VGFTGDAVCGYRVYTTLRNPAQIIRSSIVEFSNVTTAVTTAKEKQYEQSEKDSTARFPA